MLSILIVCTANICRSPMAEVILKNLVANRADADEWHIVSAGTWARYGAPAAVLSQVVVQERGLDLRDHQSQPITPELVQQADLILTMEGQQKEGLILQYGADAERIFMVSEMVDRVEDISDPIGGELIDYQATAKTMERYLSDGLEKIYRLARRRQERASS